MVSGSRLKSWPEDSHDIVKQTIAARLKWLHQAHGERLVVMEGGANGVDTWTAEACARLGIEWEMFPPDVRQPSPARFHIRNDKMLDRAGLVLAVWDGVSTGTESVIEKARHRQIELWIVTPRSMGL